MHTDKCCSYPSPMKFHSTADQDPYKKKGKKKKKTKKKQTKKLVLVKIQRSAEHEYPSPVNASTTQPPHLRHKEHCRM